MKLIASIILSLINIAAFSQHLQVAHLRCEYADEPLGIETAMPGLSWQSISDEQHVMQTAYRILVSDNYALLANDKANLWDSQKVQDDSSIQVMYKGKNLLPAHTYYWKVKVWDNHGNESGWSTIAKWQMGLPGKTDWAGAQWISNQELPAAYRTTLNADTAKDKQQGANTLPLLRKEFACNKSIRKATLFISGLGQFEVSLNGEKASDHVLDPGWTQYNKEAQYVCFDVTSNIQKGNNAISVMLGNGFYYIPPVKKRYRKLRATFGYPKMICRLLIEYTDGTGQNVTSDASWKTAASPITFSSIYGGEDYDATKEQPGWNNIHFNDSKWQPAVIVDGPAMLHAQLQQPIKVMDYFSAKRNHTINDSVYVYDFGQNASAIPSISLKGNRGDTVTLIPGELLNEDGTVNQKATGRPYYFTYILKSESVEHWTPRFSYYGFRYVQVEGAVPQGEKNTLKLPQILQITSLHIRNAAETVGHFSSSNTLFNRIDTLINWAIRSNMMSVFTDCPHREKLGWLEQDHLMGGSVQYNYDLATLYRKLVHDMMQAQTSDGLVPEIAPELVQFTYGNGMFRDSPEWGSSCIIVPWYVYQWYGDKQILQTAYAMMKKYIAYLQTKAKDNILYQGLGDWYDLGPQPPGVSQLTPAGVTATAIYYYDLTILSQVADLLGNQQDGQYYRSLAQTVKQGFNTKFFNQQTKQYATGSQTANAMAVYMQLVPDEYKDAVVNNIVRDLREHNNGLTAGDIGYHYLLKVLDDAGKSAVIYDMNSRSDVPGYGYQLVKGATALTESWQALPTNSNNHFMLGHLMEWFYNGLAGISQNVHSVAYKHIVIRPQPVNSIRQAAASFNSMYGLIKSDWIKTDNSFKLHVEIPANTTASVILPAGKTSKLFLNNQPVDDKNIQWSSANDNSFITIQTGSGIYDLEVKN
jgi:alpha-L-rhamnosidase